MAMAANRIAIARMGGEPTFRAHEPGTKVSVCFRAECVRSLGSTRMKEAAMRGPQICPGCRQPIEQGGRNTIACLPGTPRVSRFRRFPPSIRTVSSG